MILVPYLTMTDAAWDHAVSIRRIIADGPRLTLPWNDVLIAAIALRNDCLVYTLDDQFNTLARFAGVRLYTPGIGGTFVHEHLSP